MEIALTLGLSDIGCGVLFMAICIPLIRRMIPMNRYYGFRIPKAFRSDEDWYAINEFGGRAMFWWSFGLIASGAVKMTLNLGPDIGLSVTGWIIMIGPILLLSTIPILQTLVYARNR